MKKNAVKCFHCSLTIESKHVHDFVTCACKEDDKRISVDGGKEYFKRAAGKDSHYIDYLFEPAKEFLCFEEVESK